MFGIPPSSFMAIGLLGAIWLIGLWRSVQYALPESPDGGSDPLGISRKVLFHLAALLATAGPVYIFLNGLSRLSVQIWGVGILILFGIWAFWYLSVYGWSDFLFEHGDFGSSFARQSAGSPRFMTVPNWIFNNPVQFLVGLAITLTGFTFSVVYWRLSFLSFAGYGITYLFFVGVYNRLDIIKVWDKHLECRNGFSTGTPTRIPLTEIKSVESSCSAMQKRFGVSTVEIATERTLLRFTMENVAAFVAALKP